MPARNGRRGVAPPFRSRRVLVADHHPVTRAGVRHLLEDHGFEVCAEAGDARGAVEAAQREAPDVCLLNVNMPGNGIWAARQIAGKVPEASVVMVTSSTADEDLFDAATVDGFIEDLRTVLEQVVAEPDAPVLSIKLTRRTSGRPSGQIMRRRRP